MVLFFTRRAIKKTGMGRTIKNKMDTQYGTAVVKKFIVVVV
jgi:hypothetical protein